MRRYIPNPTLKNYVARYNADKKLLDKYPKQSKERELLERRIARHKEDIITYVTSENFECVLNNLNL